MQFLFKISRSLSFLTFQLANSCSTTSIGYDIMATKEKKEIRNTSRIIIQNKAKMDIFFFSRKKLETSRREGILTELIVQAKQLCETRKGGGRGKNLKEGEEIRTWSIVWKGWLRSREARQGAFSLAATKRRRFSPPLFLLLSFLFFSFLPPSPYSVSTLLPPLPVEIPRGAHSIIRYLCRTRHKSNPWQEKRPSTGQETLTPSCFSCHSSPSLP